MSKKRKKSVPTVQPKQEKKLVIDMMKVSKGGASAQLRRWLAAGLLERTSHGKYRKKGATA